MINQAHGLVRQRKRKEIPKKCHVYLSSATQPQLASSRGKICNGTLRDFRNSHFLGRDQWEPNLLKEAFEIPNNKMLYPSLVPLHSLKDKKLF